jgi:hypothetical protein
MLQTGKQDVYLISLFLGNNIDHNKTSMFHLIFVCKNIVYKYSLKDLNEDVFTPDIQTRETTRYTDLKEDEPPAPKTREHTMMTDNKEDDPQVNKMDLIPESMRGSAMAVWNTIKDLHLELILMYHRVCVKLTSMAADPTPKNPQPFKRRTCSKMEYVRYFLPIYFIHCSCKCSYFFIFSIHVTSSMIHWWVVSNVILFGQ